ncbi:MAG: hypothetical protein AAGE84_05535 [Cyanobacteria bacterium P01_G01_bin.39]
MIEIYSVKGVRNFTLAVYCSTDQNFYFDVIDSLGKFYVCPDRFSNVHSAEERAMYLIDSAIVEIEQNKFDGQS